MEWRSWVVGSQDTDTNTLRGHLFCQAGDELPGEITTITWVVVCQIEYVDGIGSAGHVTHLMDGYVARTEGASPG
jgi:hypothetical protein